MSIDISEPKKQRILNQNQGVVYGETASRGHWEAGVGDSIVQRYPGTGCFLLPVEGEVLLVMSLVQEPSHPDAG